MRGRLASTFNRAPWTANAASLLPQARSEPALGLDLSLSRCAISNTRAAFLAFFKGTLAAATPAFSISVRRRAFSASVSLESA